MNDKFISIIAIPVIVDTSIAQPRLRKVRHMLDVPGGFAPLKRSANSAGSEQHEPT